MPKPCDSASKDPIGSPFEDVCDWLRSVRPETQYAWSPFIPYWV